MINVVNMGHFMTINQNCWDGEDKTIAKTVNWHITSKCNYNCKFCSVHDFNYEIKDMNQVSSVLNIIQELNSIGTEIKCLNITGGEPTLHPLFYDILKTVKDNDIPVWISTNGSTISRDDIEIISQYAEGISISVDSISNTKERDIGRGFGNHVTNVLKVSDLINENGINLGVNTVVTKINCQDNLRSLIHRINPHKWNIFQRFPGPHQNNAFINKMANDYQFREFVRKHSHVRLRNCARPSFQNKEDILKSNFVVSSKGIKIGTLQFNSTMI